MSAGGSRREAVPKVILLTGGDDAAKRDRLRSLVDGLVRPEFEAFDLARLDARGQPVSQVLARLVTLPLGSERQVVVLFGPERLRQKEMDQLLKALPGLPDTGLLLLVTEESGDRSEAVPARLVTAVKKAGAHEDFRPLNQSQAQGFVVQRARQMGLKLGPPAARQLVFIAGTTRGVLEKELEKLLAYVGEREATAADVEAVAAATAEASVFQLTDALGARNAAAALKALGTLQSAGEKPYSLLPMILRQLRLVWQVKALQEQRLLRTPFLQLPSEVTAALPRDPFLGRLEWQKEKLAGQASKFTWPQLEESFERVLRADLVLKGIEPGPQDEQLLMESLVLGLCRVGAAGPAEAAR